MRNHAVRLYSTAVAVLGFFVVWAVIAAKPWATTPRPAPDPRLVALATREHRLQAEAVVVRGLVAGRWRAYERRLRARRRAIAAAERQHARRLAAARLALARIAAARAAASAAPASPAPVSGGGSTAAAGARVVTLPPRVQVVSLPPVTSSSSSHP